MRGRVVYIFAILIIACRAIFKFCQRQRLTKIQHGYAGRNVLELREIKDSDILKVVRILDSAEGKLQAKLMESEEKECFPWKDIRTKHFELTNYKLYKEIRKSQQMLGITKSVTRHQYEQLAEGSENALELSWSGVQQEILGLFKQRGACYVIM